MSSKIENFRHWLFLKEIFKIATSAFGGPEVHLALFSKRLVNEKKFFSQAELLETYSVCQLLPGPSSTQTITTLGYRYGGAKLGFLTLLVWILPSFVILSLLSFLYLSLPSGALHTLRFIQHMAVSYIIVASIKMMKPLLADKVSVFLAFFAFFICALLRHPLENYIKTPWMFPLVLLTGAAISYFINRNSEFHKEKKLVFNWVYLAVFVVLFISSAIIGKITHNIYAVLFENNFRFGSIVFGGGNALYPMIFEQFVKFKKVISYEEFITGVGLVQASPGPVFSVATFITGLALQNHGFGGQIIGCLIGTIAIFLPGSLLAFWLFPVWKSIKKFRFFQRSFNGIIATSTGLVAASAYLLFLPLGVNWKEQNNFFYTNIVSSNPVNWLNVAIITVICTLMFKTQISSPLWVLMAILAGIII